MVNLCKNEQIFHLLLGQTAFQLSLPIEEVSVPSPVPSRKKLRNAGELVLIMLVSKEVVAAGAWVSRSPTSCTQNLFLKS